MILVSKQRGDTIIEVLLAMSIIGLVLGSAFGIANRGVASGRSAQERTEALKIAESQLELLKANVATEPQIQATNPAFNVTGFCMISSGSPVAVAANAGGCIDQNGRGGAGLYSIRIDKPTAAAGSPYTITVIWERLSAAQANAADRKDTVTLYYKLGAL